MSKRVSPARLGVIIRENLNHYGNDSLSERAEGKRDKIIGLYKTVCGLGLDEARKAYGVLFEDILDRERPHLPKRHLYTGKTGAKFSLPKSSR